MYFGKIFVLVCIGLVFLSWNQTSLYSYKPGEIEPTAGCDYKSCDSFSTISPLITVSTFQNISLYWKPVEGSFDREALVHYRIKGTKIWLQAQSLWFDNRQTD